MSRHEALIQPLLVGYQAPLVPTHCSEYRDVATAAAAAAAAAAPPPPSLSGGLPLDSTSLGSTLLDSQAPQTAAATAAAGGPVPFTDGQIPLCSLVMVSLGFAKLHVSSAPGMDEGTHASKAFPLIFMWLLIDLQLLIFAHPCFKTRVIRRYHFFEATARAVRLAMTTLMAGPS